MKAKAPCNDPSPCLDKTESISTVLEIDISNDRQDVHPQRMCSKCRSFIERFKHDVGLPGEECLGVWRSLAKSTDSKCEKVQ